jgi:DNA repair photolyase
VKADAAELLERELAAPRYQPRTIALGANTDPYQPIERDYRVTREILEVLARTNHPVGIVTKSALVTRDIDLLGADGGEGAGEGCHVGDDARPQARPGDGAARQHAGQAAGGDPPAQRRRHSGQRSGGADHSRPSTTTRSRRILKRRAAGASEAGYVLLRLPLEVREVFAQWLVTNAPDKARHVLSLIRSTRGGKDYDSRFGVRQTGDGPLPG